MQDCKLVAEIGINHNGDLEIAKKLIDVASLSGCQYVKFQKRDINLVYTKEELNRYRESPWGTTNREQKEGLELSYDDYCKIDEYCKKKKIQWFASAWDVNSVDFLEKFKVPFMKIPSALITNENLLYKVKKTGIPTIISCGMSNKKEIDNCIKILGDQIEYILSCTSSYPTPVEEMNMNRIKTLQKLYGKTKKIGFSNHFYSIQFIILAYILNCKMIEYHITLNRAMYGSDQAASIEPTGAYKIKGFIDTLNKGWGDGKIGCLPSEIKVKEKLRK